MKTEQSNRIPLLIECACGCGREFKPKYRWHRYYETKCRTKDWIKKQAENAVTEEVNKLEKRVEFLEQKLSGK